MFEYSARVVNVVDGDTLDMVIDLGFAISRKERFRLFGINTPEVVGKNKQAGLDVKRHVESVVLDQTVFIKSHKDERDKYGRYLAEVIYTDPASGRQINLNSDLISRGFAKPYDGVGPKPE